MDMQTALMQVHDLSGNGQANPAPFFFCRKEGNKNIIDGSGRDTGAEVRYFYKLVAVTINARLDQNNLFPGVGKCLFGILDQVDQDHLDLFLIGSDVKVGRVNGSADINFTLSQVFPQQHDDILKERLNGEIGKDRIENACVFSVNTHKS